MWVGRGLGRGLKEQMCRQQRPPLPSLRANGSSGWRRSSWRLGAGAKVALPRAGSTGLEEYVHAKEGTRLDCGERGSGTRMRADTRPVHGYKVEPPHFGFGMYPSFWRVGLGPLPFHKA